VQHYLILLFRSRLHLSFLTTALGIILSSSVAADPTEVPWRDWSDRVFADALKEKKLILLDLQAVWCHWCHVMDEKTYSRPEVIKALSSKFIPVRADQDAHPDLSTRYRDYGWPATVVLNGKGEDLRILSGFVEPEDFEKMLQGVLQDPRPKLDSETKESDNKPGVLNEELRATLRKRHENVTDLTTGGLTTAHRYLDPSSVEYALLKARSGDARNTDWVTKTLDANLKLIDPVWGGVFQYSTHYDWDHPHFEKIMSAQAANINLYTYAYGILKKPAYLDAAVKIGNYLLTFLRSPDGVFYVSQDADAKPGEHSDTYFKLDDAARRQQGIPTIDKHQYARENGWAIEAMTALYSATGDKKYLEAAQQAGDWVIANRRTGDGGFTHGDSDKGGPFLSDTLQVGVGLLSLYAATGERRWFDSARTALDFIAAHFAHEKGIGFYASDPKTAGVLKPVRKIEENAALARFANLMRHYSGREQYDSIAKSALSYLAQPSTALDSISEPIILIADEEIAAPPPHFTVVGKKDDDGAKQLWNTIVHYNSRYIRREWWDKREGDMPNPDVQYPTLPRAAGFVCANKRCSLPLFTVVELEERIKQG